MMAQHSSNNCDAIFPLRKWIKVEAKKLISTGSIAGFREKQHKKEVILRKTTIAFG